MVSSCAGATSTADLLSATDISANLATVPLSASVVAGGQQSFVINGGKAPYAVRVLGTGSATVVNNTITYTAGSLIDVVSLIVTDKSNRQATASVSITAVEVIPADISGLVYWLKADALALSNGAAVTAWTDASGNGKDFTSTGSPIFQSNAVNNLAAVSFNGTSQYIQRAFEAAMNSANMTWFVLFLPTDVSVGWTIFNTRENFPRGFMLNNTAGGVSSFAFGEPANSSWRVLASVATTLANSWHLAEGRADAQTATYTLDGNLQGQLSLISNAYQQNTASVTRIGAGEAYTTPSTFFNGKIAEIIFFNRGLTSAEQQSVRCYIKRKYAQNFGC